MNLQQGQVAVVTGAASGIGLAMAHTFAGMGMRVVLADIEQPVLDAAVADLAATGAEVIGVQTDVAHCEQIERLATTAYERFGSVNVLCNNAGVVTSGRAWEQSRDDWEWVIAVDLWSVIHGCRVFVPRMLAGGDDGYIVNTASMAGLVPFAGLGSYDVAKAGVVALSEALYHDLRGTRLGVSVVCPGGVATRIGSSERNRPGAPPAAAAAEAPRMSDRFPNAEILDPSEVARQTIVAIESDQFWVVTHPSYDEDIRRRSEAILDRRSVWAPQPR